MLDDGERRDLEQIARGLWRDDPRWCRGYAGARARPGRLRRWGHSVALWVSVAAACWLMVGITAAISLRWTVLTVPCGVASTCWLWFGCLRGPR